MAIWREGFFILTLPGSVHLLLGEQNLAECIGRPQTADFYSFHSQIYPIINFPSLVKCP
jgi:hypothetical protein